MLRDATPMVRRMTCNVAIFMWCALPFKRFKPKKGVQAHFLCHSCARNGPCRPLACRSSRSNPGSRTVSGRDPAFTWGAPRSGRGRSSWLAPTAGTARRHKKQRPDDMYGRLRPMNRLARELEKARG